MKKWISGLLLIAVLVCAAACAKSETPNPDSDISAETAEMPETKNYKEGVIEASELIIQNGVALWGYEDRLCSALLDDNGDLYDFVSEGSMPAEIYLIALNGNVMYFSTDIGIVRLPLTDREQGQSEGVLLDDYDIGDHPFQIYDGIIYFTYGYSLYAIPEDGGERQKLDSDVTEFQVTSEGIYCLNRNGELTCVSLDGKTRQTLCELDSKGDLLVFLDKIYITTGENKAYIYVYEPETKETEKLHFENALTPYSPVWVTEDCIYYESDDHDVFRYDLASQEETPCDVSYDLPDYHAGCLVGDVFYYVYADYVYWMHSDSGESFRYAKKELLEGNAGGSSSSGSTSDSTSGSSSGSGSASGAATDHSTGSYNIAEDIGIYSSEGQARLESKYFTLYLPADGDWDYKVINNTTISIYYPPAYEAGYGGELVTIAAYDWGDNSYADDPAYTIAGKSEDKIYVAFFPTDVQYGSGQADGYRQMLKYVQRIDSSEEHAANNPFSCW